MVWFLSRLIVIRAAHKNNRPKFFMIEEHIRTSLFRTPNPEQELEELKQILREYLQFPSSDGKQARQKLRKQLEELIK
jgi:hypothetical protein